MSSERPDYLEAVVELREGADASRVERWLERHGLAPTRMVVGFLASGDASSFEHAFGIDPSAPSAPDELPVRDELREDVAKVAIVPPKRTHQ
jgi:hypothetical protein